MSCFTRAGLGTFRPVLVLLALLTAGCGSGSTSAPAPAPSAAPGKTSAPAAASEVVGKAAPKAIVILEPTGGSSAPPPTEPKVMDQAGYTFYPGLLLAQQGQRVEFRNSEDVLHNIRVANADTREVVFNVATPPYGTYGHTFDKAGYYSVTCDVHTAMSASIFVTASPYAVVADENGSFSLSAVPAGTYTLVVYGDGTHVDRVLEITAGRTELDVRK